MIQFIKSDNRRETGLFMFKGGHCRNGPLWLKPYERTQERFKMFYINTIEHKLKRT